MKNDWRLLNQEEYLVNAKLIKTEYKSLLRSGITTTVLSVEINSAKTTVTCADATAPQTKVLDMPRMF